jgi:VWFA-related protein
MRFYAAVLAVLLANPAAAQFKDRLDVRLLEIEATVVDKHDKPVHELTGDDFAVTLDTKPAAIEHFAAVRRGTIEQVPTRLIVVVDDLHLHPATKQHALEGLYRFVANSMDARTTASLVTWNGTITMAVKPTTRRDLLLQGIARIARDAPRGMAVDGERRAVARLCQSAQAACAQTILQFAESQAEDTERTVRALGEIVETAAGMDGRKVVLLLSEGMPTLAGVELFAIARDVRGITTGAMALNKTRDIRALARKAQDAGVLFCTIDPSLSLGVDAGMDEYRIDRQQIRIFARESGRILAHETGGRLITDENDLHRAITVLDEQVSTYYSLAVRAPSTAEEGVAVQVRVKDRPELRVVTAVRRSITARQEAVENAVRSHLYLPREQNPLEATLSLSMEKTEPCVAMMQLLIPKEKLTLSGTGAIRGELDVRLAVLDDMGQESEVFATSVLVTDKHGAVIGQGVPLRLGMRKYALSVGVVDRGSGMTSYFQREVDCTR